MGHFLESPMFSQEVTSSWLHVLIHYWEGNRFSKKLCSSVGSQTWVQILALPLTSGVTSDKLGLFFLISKIPCIMGSIITALKGC